MTKLNRIKVVVNVTDIAHVETAIRALATIEENTHQGIEAEVIVAPGLSAEFSAALQKRIARLNDLSQ